MAWHPTLDSIEGRPDTPWTRPRRTGSPCAEGTGPLDMPLAGPGCWCGEVYGHYWAGKADGAPHPRGQASNWVTGYLRLPGGGS
jgi:hypothetical protein